MLRFLHPNKFWLFPAIVQNSVLPCLRLTSKNIKFDCIQDGKHCNIIIIHNVPVKQAANVSPQDTWTIVTPDCPSRNFGSQRSSSNFSLSAVTSDDTSIVFLFESQMIARPPPVTPVFIVLPDATCTTSESCCGSCSLVGVVIPPPQWYTKYLGSSGLVEYASISERPSRERDADFEELVR